MIKFFGNSEKFNKGFTLIELSVVLFLIGLLFFTAMPRLENFLFQSDLKGFARSLKATIQLLRSKSITTHKLTVLHFDLDKGLYWGAYLRGDDELEPNQPASDLIPPRSLPEGIRILDVYNVNTEKKTFGQFESSFNPKGVVEETVLHLADSRNRVLTIVINAYTGRFLLYDAYVDVEYGGNE